MLELVEVSKIYPHPENPRKNIGDITELADSIKASGVLQNLTLVPRDKDTYTVIIGHRRLAAAKKAGLEKVPCVVTNMDEKEQIATMLLENMQRTDLTLYEQAQGFQMMLDFGETVDYISEKTGFSKATVRRRVKLLELDSEKFKKASDRGATLMDYAKLDKIKDLKLKNQVLDSIGTPNFNWALKKAISDEQSAEGHVRALEAIRKFATEITERGDLRYCCSYYFQDENFEPPKDAGKCEYFYLDLSYRIELYRHYTSEERHQSEMEREKRVRSENIHQQFNDIARKAFELRMEFIKNLHGKTHTESIMKFACASSLYRSMNYCYTGNLTDEKIGQLLNIPEDKRENLTEQIEQGRLEVSPALSTENVLAAVTYCLLGDREEDSYADYSNRYMKNAKLDMLYDFLESMGYVISDEERAWKDGTHELYESAAA